MKEKEFVNLLETLVEEILGYQVTDYEKRYFWGRFQNTSNALKIDLSVAWEIEAMVHYNEVDILRFRNKMANSGIEITIRQAEIWLVMLEIALLSVDFYEWEGV